MPGQGTLALAFLPTTISRDRCDIPLVLAGSGGQRRTGSLRLKVVTSFCVNSRLMKRLLVKALILAVAISANPATAAVPTGPASCGTAGDKYVASLINAKGDDRAQEVAYSIAGDYAAACAEHDVASEMTQLHKTKAEADRDVYFRAYFLYLKATALAHKVGNKVIRCHDINAAVTMSIAMGKPLDTNNPTVKQMLDGC
jgi:hypothetical protein